MLTMAMATTAMAAEYNIDGPEDPLFASPTSVDQVTVVGGGVTEQSNIDRIAFVTLREMSLAYHSLNTGYWGKGKQTGKNPVFMRVCGEMALKS